MSVAKQEMLTERLDGPVLSAASDTPQPDQQDLRDAGC